MDPFFWSCVYFVPDKIVDSLKLGRASQYAGGRWLGFCLLLLIAYGSTADAIHHHGNVVPRASVKFSCSTARQSASTAVSDLIQFNTTFCTSLEDRVFRPRIVTPLIEEAPSLTVGFL